MVAAERYANHIASYWTTDQRMFYYNSSKLMKIANQRFDENDMDGAITLWQEVYKKESTTLKALAAYNLGLAYEMLDNLDECESWLLKSKAIKRYAPVYNYLSIIRKRKTEHEKLDKMLLD
jgi:tetratricopeptide (TPR) repeat protein